MAAIVTGLIPILRTAVEASTDYTGRTLWFGFLTIRLVTLYISEMPWGKLDSDFSCNVTYTDFCHKSCFNQHFNLPMVSLWNFTYILFAISVLLMELFASQLRHNLIKKRLRKDPTEDLDVHITITGVKGHDLANKDMMIDFHRRKTVLCLYLMTVFLRIAIEAVFLTILIFWQLPKVDGEPFLCQTELCPGPYICIVRASPEKQMSIYTLVFISGMILLTNVVFFLYSVCHYLILGRSGPPSPV
ncbi:gap junction beta-2 protein-like [Erpetoichthys calabaricus]|uniref:Gap junction protein zeta 1 n=1 Tax=Erpetoichthys calabaricus TaxID=27687 RepID=A0A8C4SKA5_ERPCA|nr:gap junction beta-2 protein-like [Erpetoichthys calabaricus]